MIWKMFFAGRTFSADALRGLRRPSHKTQYDSETVTLSRQFTLFCREATFVANLCTFKCKISTSKITVV